MEKSNESFSFVKDIRPLFRDFDVQSMMAASGMDLADYGTVSTHSQRILQLVELGDMPCDQPWGEEKITVFRQWIEQGKQP